MGIEKNKRDTRFSKKQQLDILRECGMVDYENDWDYEDLDLIAELDKSMSLKLLDAQEMYFGGF